MFDTRPQDMDDHALVEAVTALGAHLAAGTARLLEVVSEAEKRGLPGSWDAKDAGQWLSWLTGFSPSKARDHAVVAGAIDDFPETKKALSSGEISFDQAKAITRSERPDHEDELVELAKSTTAGQLMSVVSAYRRASAPGHADAAYERRYLHYFFDDHDSFVLTGRLAKDDGAIVAKAIEVFRDEFYRANDREQYLPQEKLSADALVAVADAALGSDNKRSGADATQVVVHVDADALVTDDPDARCEIAGAGGIATATARRLGCDASIVTMIEKDGQPLSVGRKTRKVPHGIRRALMARDQMCKFWGCTHARYTDAHHIEYWTEGGETSLDNLMLLCRFHHRLVHERGYRIERDNDENVDFIRPDGSRVAPVITRPRACATDVVSGNATAGIDVKREPAAPEGAGRSLDLDYVTWVHFFQYDQLDRRRRAPPEEN
jgi:hypothetical protein